MRIGASPSLPVDRRSSVAVAPADFVRPRGERETGTIASRQRRRENPAAAEAFVPPAPDVRSAATSLAGIVAQSLFHARFGGRPEESTIHAARAYLRTSDLSFADARSTLRVA